ncbi:hypothetical protein [Anaplasma phagocytophilum]|nr:hypothetical protein [Anaplasma phagocytophilum]
MIGGFFHEWCYSTVVMAGGDSGIGGRRVRCLTADVVCSLTSKLYSKGELYWC